MHVSFRTWSPCDGFLAEVDTDPTVVIDNVTSSKLTLHGVKQVFLQLAHMDMSFLTFLTFIGLNVWSRVAMP